MAQVFIDIKDYKRNNNILQDLVKASRNCAIDDKMQVTPPMAQANVNNNNNWQNNSTGQGLSRHPMEYFFVILDPDAEYVLQNVSDEMFFRCFNFDKVVVRCLLMELHQRTYYHPINEMYRDICFDMSVLVTLSYLVNGHLEYVMQLGYFNHYSAEALNHCIERVCQIIVNFLSPAYVRFPGFPEEQRYVKYGFLRQFGVPGVVGALECYYVRLQNVPQHERNMYVSRRCAEPSLTVQVICDHNYRFLDVNARFSGNACNTHVWKHSHIKEIINHSQEKYPQTWLIADRGYPLSGCLISPYRNAHNIQQESVNMAFKEIHKVVDKSFALLKARFRCLNEALPFTHKHATNVISSCVALHNYLLAKKRPIEENLNVQPAKPVYLKNATNEDIYSTDGMLNRSCIKDFMLHNSMKILYRMRMNPALCRYYIVTNR